MKPIRDPDGEELKHLVSACELAGKKILEIGCGDGVFARQYAHMADRVVGIDPLGPELKIAHRKARTSRSIFLQGMGEWLPFSPHTFDIVLFGSSL